MLRDKIINEVKNILTAVDNMGSKSTTVFQNADRLGALEETRTILTHVLQANNQQAKHAVNSKIEAIVTNEKTIQQKNIPG